VSHDRMRAPNPLARFRILCEAVHDTPGMFGTAAEGAATLYGAARVLGLSRDGWYATLASLGLTQGNRVAIDGFKHVERLAVELSQTAPQWLCVESTKDRLRGRCHHTRHKHGWWCVRCLKRAAPRGVEEHVARGVWHVTIGPVNGDSSQRVHAWQAAIERCEMDGVSLA